MPQKKNPDVPELVRGKTGRVNGHLVALLTLMKAQPLAYNKDNQEDKEPLFDTVDTLTDSLVIYAEMLASLQVDNVKMRAQAEKGYATATDLADYLVKRGVPFRNAHLLSVATSWAEVIGARSIYIGAVAEDSSGYPDCRPEFYEAFQKVIALGTKPETQIEIRTPVISLKKFEIIKLGQKLKAPFELTWSCYRESAEACGDCDSCALRLRAFHAAGLKDPVPYLLDSKRFAY